MLHKKKLCDIIFPVISMKIVKQKGTRDIYFEESNIWQFVEKNIRDICSENNISEIRTPVFEATELYARGVGDDTDIVNKEMYTFLDKGGRSITLRPELTAGVVRAYIENGMASLPSPLKFWYMANMYRYEKMQKGRYREFAQFGLEIFGSDSYLADIETILISYELMKRLKLDDKVILSLNSIGCPTCRKAYIEKFKEYLRPNLDNMCDTCKVRFEKNPLRILDCKEEKCKKILEGAPMITDSLCEDCNEDFENLKNTLKMLNINFEVDKKIVRGLDYYNKTVYEWTSKDLNLAVGGGGRYDTLVEKLGGAHTPAVGFGIGMDRLVLLLKEYGLDKKTVNVPDVCIANYDAKSYALAKSIASKLTENGFKVDVNISNKTLKAQIKYADKIKSRYLIIIGEDELNKNVINLKNMQNGEQSEIDLNDTDKLICILKEGNEK